jgi:tRNA threonylcarbamoyl adenosine modification protein YeaZ
MIILTIDTTGDCVFGVLQEDDGMIDKFISSTNNRHAELLLPLVEDFLRKNNVSYRSIDCFSAVNGPGSFMGLKISMAFIKAIRCAIPNTKIILNSIFQILSFRREYDFVVLEANADGLYVSDGEQNNFYRDKEEFSSFLREGKRLVTNSQNVVDFLKSSNIILERMDANRIISLNYFRYINSQFDMGEIKPVYIRESQINTKHG